MNVPAPVEQQNVVKMVERFIVLRNAKREGEAVAIEMIKQRYGNEMEELKEKLLAKLNEMGVESIRSKKGTVHKIRSVSLKVEDQRMFQRHIIGGELWDLIEWRPLKSGVNELVEGGEPVPPGLRREVFTTVGVRDGK